MKILVVDDESEKLKNIMRELKSIDGIIDSSIKKTLEMNIAKIELQNTEYDFLILDLNMPELLGEENRECAGIDFIDEIMEVDSYKKPRQIIVLTECDNAEKAFLERQKKYQFLVLHYENTSVEWADNIKGKIRYALACENSREKDERAEKFDLAIVTAVKIETDAVKDLSTIWNRREFTDDPTIYYETVFNGKKSKITVIHAQQSEMGLAAAATLCTKIISNHKPRYIIMVGITAGIGEGKELGDIIIPSTIWNYSSGKYVSEKADLLNFIPDPYTLQLNPKIREKANLDFKGVLFEIKNKFNGAPKNDLNIITGPMACGSAVIASNLVVEKLIKKHFRKTVGLDMESYGVFYSVANATGVHTDAICIKSICDFADGHKNDESQCYAAYTSASFMKYFVENELDF